MLLTETTDKLSLITDQAGDIDVVVTYIDRVTSTGAIGAAGRQLTTITTATTTDILAAPAADTTRQVECISIRNAHATVVNDVTVQFNANGTLYELHAARLYVIEMLEWEQGTGFTHKCRRTKPTNECRVSAGTARSTAVVTGNDANVTLVPQCNVDVKATEEGSAVRVVCSLYCWHDSAAATTTGVAIGMIATSVAFSASNNQNIQTCVDSVTGATLSAHDAGAADSLIANGTSGTAEMMGIGGGSVKWTEAALPAERYSAGCYLGLQSEIGGSQVTVGGGTLYLVFEATDVG